MVDAIVKISVGIALLLICGTVLGLVIWCVSLGIVPAAIVTVLGLTGMGYVIGNEAVEVWRDYH